MVCVVNIRGSKVEYIPRNMGILFTGMKMRDSMSPTGGVFEVLRKAQLMTFDVITTVTR